MDVMLCHQTINTLWCLGEDKPLHIVASRGCAWKWNFNAARRAHFYIPLFIFYCNVQVLGSIINHEFMILTHNYNRQPDAIQMDQNYIFLFGFLIFSPAP